VALLGRWAVRLLLYHDFGAHDALPWLALGWALYGLYLIFVVISGRARRTRRNLPAALVGLAVNIAGLFLLVPRLGISGAGIALVIAYTAMLLVIYWLTRSIFKVGFEWGRLARLLAVLITVSVAGELALPTSGAGGFLLRGLAWCTILPLLAASGFFSPAERAWIAALAGRIRQRGRGPA
jgi:O-antigen/teichoic acid export membrane protein